MQNEILIGPRRRLVLRVALVLCVCGLHDAEASQRPNVVLIMTDNQGAWTLGCYGNADIRSPNIDRLAGEGTLFTRAFACNPVCSPTRATFLTGLIPSQHGVHCFLRSGRLQIGAEARNTLADFQSLSEVLQDAGYACGLIGKWHLGDNLNPQEGFDNYWTTTPHGGTSTFYGASVIENGRIRREPKYLTDFWTDHATRFIAQRKTSEKPFFLFLAYNGPYSLGRLLFREGRNRHAAYYADKELPSFPRQPTHPWQYSNRDYMNNPVSIRRVATEVSGIDDGVGRVMTALKEHGLDDNTVVIFVADQGWVGGHGGFFGMGDHTRPTTARDGMMQIPMIWRHPGRIRAAATSDVMVSNYDFMPTLLSYLGLGEKMPEEPKSPGRDFSSALRSRTRDSRSEDPANSGEPLRKWDNVVFYEFEHLRCIRTAQWKYVHRHPHGPHELYDLLRDPAEFNNLVNEASHTAIRRALKERLEEFYTTYAEPKYDLYREGSSQTALLGDARQVLGNNLLSNQDRTVRRTDGEEPSTRSSQTVAPSAAPPQAHPFTPAEINVPNGFTVELAAGPPLVRHPTFATFDEHGRLFVCENAGVNMTAHELEEKLPNSIRLIEDVDGDGRFDKSTIFADKMTFPMGGAWHNGALYVASPPNIWRLEDIDGDGVADKRDVLVGSFGYTGNAASIHGCFFGPDGRLYWCDGYHGHEFKDEAGEMISKREGSYIFSCRQDGSDVRLHCGGGMDNPVEVDFTDEGEVLGTVNILYSRPRVDALVHWLFGGAYPHRERVLDEIKITGEVLGPAHRFGHVAVSGMTRYRSGVMDHRWRDNVFATFFNSGKVARLQMEREDATFRATQREFLSSTSSDFHPTDVLEDADGSLLVIDTGGWFYRGCPTSQYAKPDVRGAIYRVRRSGMTTLADPWGKRIDWSKLTNGELVIFLGDVRFEVRRRATAECAQRGGAIVEELQRVLRQKDSLQRRNAVWALTRMIDRGEAERSFSAEANATAATGTRDNNKAEVGFRSVLAQAQATIRGALDDPHRSVRLAACRSVATNSDAAAVERLIELVRDDQPPIRREAATALGGIGDESAVAALLEALGHNIDRTEEHALIYALIEINAASATRTGLSSKNAGTRRGALIALDQMDNGDLLPDDVVPLFEPHEPRLLLAAADVFSRHRDWADRAAVIISRLLTRSDSVGQNSKAIRRLTKMFLAEPTVGALIGSVLQDSRAPGATRDLLLAAIADGQRIPLHTSWVEPFERLLGTNDQRTMERTLAALAAVKTDRFRAQLRRLGADESRAPMLRVAALEVASGKSGRVTDASFGLLIKLVGTAEPNESLRAAQMIGASSLSRTQLILLAPLLSQASSSQLHELIQPFQRSQDTEVAKAFLAEMENAHGLTSLASHEFSDVVKRFAPELLPAANRLLDRIRKDEQRRIMQLDRLIPLVEQGDAARGSQLFFSEKSKCSSCHRVGERGDRIGPDLTTIGASRRARDLLESIVFPSATLVRDYEPFTLVTTDGRTLSGLITRETRDTTYIQQQTGDPVAVPRDAIEQLAPSTVSMMPGGLEKALSESELADVVAYLMSLKLSSGRSHASDP